MAEVKERPLLREWKEIAAAMECAVDTAQRLADRNVDPLPIRYDFVDRPTLRVDALQDWIDRNELPYGAYHAMREAKQLPSQQGRGRGTLKKRSA